jgi:RHS repeat-associated protein
MGRINRRTASTVVALLLSAAQSLAQDPLAEPVRDSFLSQVKSPLELSDFREDFNPYSGQVAIRLTTVDLPGKSGLDLVVPLYYNSEVWNRTEQNLRSHVASNDTAGNLGGGGWQLHFGKIFNPEGQGSPNSTTQDNPYLVMPDGTTRIFYDDAAVGIAFVSEDRWRFEETGFRTFLVTDPKGNEYEFSYAGEAERKTRRLEFIAQCTRVTDVHGNEITIEYLGGKPTVVTDSLGRTIEMTYVSGTDRLQYIDVKNLGAQLQRWEFRYAASPMLTWDNGPVEVYAPTELVPPQGASWLFEYNSSATDPSLGGVMLKKVTLPTGGTISYNWTPKNFNVGCLSGAVVQRPVLVSRVTGGRDVTSATYSYAYSSPGSNGSTTTVQLTSPAGLTWSETYVTDGYGGFNEFDSNLWKVGRVRSKTTVDALQTIVETPVLSEGDLLSQHYRSSTYWFNCGNNRKDAEIRFIEPVTVTRAITRVSSTWTTIESDFDNYGNPQQIDESGEIARSTELTWWYSETDHILEGRLASRLQTPGVRETFTYNADGTLQKQVLNHSQFSTTDGVTTTFTYDAAGQRTSSTTPNSLGFSRVVNYLNYSFGFPETERHPTSGAPGNQVDLKRDITALGLVSWEEDGRTSPANRVDYGYDSWGRRTSINPAVGETTSISYAADGSTITVSRGSGATLRSTIYSFDGFGRLRSKKDVQRLDEEVTTYDALGRKTQTQYKLGGSNADKHLFDVLGRLTRVVHPDLSTIELEYFDNTVDLTDETFATTRFTYQSFGDPSEKRLRFVLDAESKTWTYNYHSSYHLLEQIVTPTNVGNRSFTYSTKQFLQSETHPESGTTTYTLSGLGERVGRSRGGTNVSYSYDHMGRQYAIDPPGSSSDVTISYNEAGLATSIANSEASYSQTWDGDRRMTQRVATIAGRAYTTSYGWDGHDRLTRITYPSGRVVDYAYDNKGRVTSVTSPTEADWLSSITYYSHGGVNTLNYANGAFTSISYDARFRPTLFATQTVDLDVDYDEANRIDSWISNGLTQSFGYDDLGRLTSATSPYGVATSFTYAENGNRKTQTIGGVVETYNYGADQRLSSVTGGFVASYGYDLAGRLTSAPGRTLTWTGLDRMASVTISGTTSTYGYDGEGRRVRATVGAESRYFVLDPSGNLLAEYDGAGALIVEHVYLEDRRIGSRYADAKRIYTQHDAVGSAWILTSETGSTYAVYRYWAFGEEADPFQAMGSDGPGWPVIASEVATFIDGFNDGTMSAWLVCNGVGTNCSGFPEDVLAPAFTGKELDEESGLYYFEARYLDPRIGRFTSPDEGPFKLQDPQSFNRYAYAQNSPFKYRDPDGRVIDTILDIGFIAYDVFDIARSLVRGEGIRGTQLAALGADIGGAALPFATGGGAAIRAAAHADGLGRVASAVRGGDAASGAATELVQRAMSMAELEATRATGLVRGGRSGTHYVSDSIGADPLRARQRLALQQTPEVRVTLEVPAGSFSPPSKIPPSFGMPGGGSQRVASGQIPATVKKVHKYRNPS